MEKTFEGDSPEDNPVQDLMSYLGLVKSNYDDSDLSNTQNPDAVALQILHIKHLIQKVAEHCDLNKVDEHRFKGPSFSMFKFLEAVESVKDYYEKRFTGPPYRTQIMADKLRVVRDALNAVIRDYTKGIRVQDEA